MEESSASNSKEHISSSGLEVAKSEQHVVKQERDAVVVKPEPLECCVCLSRSADCVALCAARTSAGSRVADILAQYSRDELLQAAEGPTRQVCGACAQLVDVLEQAEREYNKLKEAFQAVISKNPLFDNHTRDTIVPVKFEYNTDAYNEPCNNDDSEDEPLAVTKKKRRRRVVRSKKKVCTTAKRKPRSKKSSFEAEESKLHLSETILSINPTLSDIKREDSVDSSENSQLNGLDSMLKMEIDYDDDEDDSNFMPDELSNGVKSDVFSETSKKSGRVKLLGKSSKKKQPVYQCDQCDAKYTTIKRLELHREKHSDGKPPYICEVCGAHYKHKRACDIHVGLHKGISDWKCEECNKLFPSKGALQRHNNIHTGRLNYQCDLCGKSFIHTSSFKMHKLSHSGVKPHSCDVCGLALMTRSHLKRHKRVHSGEKRHECAVCGKRFSERYNLVAHAKSHEAAGEAALPPQPRRRLFRCPYCQERFERRYMLERHVSVSHGRTLERAPATPRNTMSKLLKAQAQARALPAVPHPPPPQPPHTPASDITDTKEERSPDSRSSSIQPQKLQFVSSMTTITAGSWSGAYAAEFGLRSDYSH